MTFNQAASRFQAQAKSTLDNLEYDMINLSETEDEIDELENKLSRNVESAKEDLNQQIDSLQLSITSKRPQPGDPNYAKKREQYVKLLSSSVDGMDLLRAGLTKIFNRLKQIVTNILGWIARKISGIVRMIKDAFTGLISFLF